MELTIEENKVVTIVYELRDNNSKGELLEIMDARYPFIFFYGSGKLLPAFEKHLYGLKESNSFEFILEQKDAYGPHNVLNIIDVERKAFKVGGEVPPDYIKKDNLVSLTDDLGDIHNGKILSWTDSHVKVDFNHIMAGKTLHFKGAVLAIREATIDELVRKHYIKEDGIRGWEYGESD